MADKQEDAARPVIIKKYANRRLYNTATSSYVTLDHLAQMVKDGTDFVVLDAKGTDITRAVLTQIIVEQEGKGENLLPINFLRQIISFYGDSMQRMLLPHYLEYSISTFARNQERIRAYMQDTFGNMFPFNRLEEMGKQNIAMFERAMRMFAPFPGTERDGAPDRDGAPETGGDAEDTATIEELRRKLNDIQRQIDAMTDRGKG